MQGKPNKFILEPLNLLIMLSEAVMVESEPYSKIGRTHCKFGSG